MAPQNQSYRHDVKERVLRGSDRICRYLVWGNALPMLFSSSFWYCFLEVTLHFVTVKDKVLGGVSEGIRHS